eukprot:sb/3478782/
MFPNKPTLNGLNSTSFPQFGRKKKKRTGGGGGDPTTPTTPAPSFPPRPPPQRSTPGRQLSTPVARQLSGGEPAVEKEEESGEEEDMSRYALDDSEEEGR